ncbi:MAG TPA: DUF6152 family protein [Sphingomonadaceae bacterium]
MNKALASLAAGALVVASAAPALAHHSYAMFDMTKTVTLNGSVVQFKWQNPHSFVRLDVPVNGAVEHWAIEMTSPNNLAVEGWKRSTLKPGDKVTIQVHPLRDGAKGGSFAAVKLADGTTLGKWQ